MRQTLIIASLVGSTVIFALVIDLFDTLFMFLLFGILPGQGQRLSANEMLTIYGGAAAAVLIYGLRARLSALVGFVRSKRQERTNPA